MSDPLNINKKYTNSKNKNSDLNKHHYKKILSSNKVMEAIFDQINAIKEKKEKRKEAALGDELGIPINDLASRSHRRWIGVLNYPILEEYEKLKKIIKNEEIKCFIMSYEFGSLGRSPHFQIYLEFEKAKAPIQYIGVKRITFAKAKKDKDTNVKYVTGIKKNYEIGTILLIKNILIPASYKRGSILKLSKMFPWQRKIYNLLQRPPSDRVIFWIHDLGAGNVGKTALSRILVMTCGAIRIGNARTSSLTHAVAYYTYDSKSYPPIIVIDAPRATLNKVDYGALENLKDCLIFTDRYNAQCVIGKNHPHMIIFSNYRPNLKMFSQDRWVIFQIKDNDLFLEKMDLRHINDVRLQNLNRFEKNKIRDIKGDNFYEMESEHYITPKYEFYLKNQKLEDFNLSAEYK